MRDEKPEVPYLARVLMQQIKASRRGDILLDDIASATAEERALLLESYLAVAGEQAEVMVLEPIRKICAAPTGESGLTSAVLARLISDKSDWYDLLFILEELSDEEVRRLSSRDVITMVTACLNSPNGELEMAIELVQKLPKVHVKALDLLVDNCEAEMEKCRGSSLRDDAQAQLELVTKLRMKWYGPRTRNEREAIGTQ
jgi:hypothetical protein